MNDTLRLEIGFTQHTDDNGITWTPRRITSERRQWLGDYHGIEIAIGWQPGDIVFWGVRKPGDGVRDHEAGSSVSLAQALVAVRGIARRYLAESLGAA